MKRWLYGLGLCALVACGGRVVEAPPDGSGSNIDEEPSVTPSGGKSSTGSDGFPMHALPECKPGFPRSDSTRSCDWVSASGSCFATKTEACACTCPRDRDSVCVSGFFDGPGSATKVACD